jgi:hypothetical protein
MSPSSSPSSMLSTTVSPSRSPPVETRIFPLAPWSKVSTCGMSVRFNAMSSLTGSLTVCSAQRVSRRGWAPAAREREAATYSSQEPRCHQPGAGAEDRYHGYPS